MRRMLLLHKIMSLRAGTALLLAITTGLGGCAETATISTADGKTQVSATTPSAFTQFPEIAVPPNTTINVDQTLIVGSKPWFGRLALESFTSANRSFDFFLNNMSNLGWERKQAVRGTTNILTYENVEREMTILIMSRTLAGSEITITVSPQDQTEPQSPPGGNLPQPVTQQ